jgi:hypothetical protein
MLSSSSEELLEISLYPNPVIDELNIRTQNIEIFSINIYTIEGKEIRSFGKKGLALDKINFTNLDSGIYFLEILTDVGQVIKKVIKK